jgi:di/tricarboxylate transporter
MGGEGRRVAAGVIFAEAISRSRSARIPGLSIDRAGIALVGAGLMVASGALPLEDAYKAIDLDTITLLLGMMIVVASLRLSGFFAVANTLGHAHAKATFDPARRGRRDLRRFFRLPGERRDLPGAGPARAGVDARAGTPAGALPAGVAMASNVGSTATITGNPQNIMIGSFSQIPYTKFALALGPVALAGLIGHRGAHRAVPPRRVRRRRAPGSGAAEGRCQSRAGDPRACWRP